MTSNIFTCPVCKELLFQSGNSMKCCNNHSFDISRRGYVNLLLSNTTSNHGDDKNMVIARRDFLNLGYYSKLAETISDTIVEYASDRSNILDIGCGEGYYTSLVKEKLNSCGNSSLISGIDISKTALDYACRRNNTISYAVASAFALPLADNAVDIVLNIFAPHEISEISRVLKDNGYFVIVLPQKRHLWELKELVYDNPYENESPIPDFNGFSLVQDTNVQYKIDLKNNKEILDLFSMTPYLYTTKPEDMEKMKAVDHMQLTADFRIAVLQKNNT
ncbi:MAG: methyltransferase domain-containing protein [Clostridiales bacterium]|nr:methyltransferase domain-containing protein [Clostridiales bacterium]